VDGRKLRPREGHLLVSFIFCPYGNRKGDTSEHTGVKTVRWTVFSPWEIPFSSGPSFKDVDGRKLRPREGHLLVSFIFARTGIERPALAL